MRILLQHAHTGLYLQNLGNWTADLCEAMDFQHSQKAIDFACKHGIVGIQVAVRSFDHVCDEILPPPAIAGDSGSSPRLAVNS